MFIKFLYITLNKLIFSSEMYVIIKNKKIFFLNMRPNDNFAPLLS